jgi:hypothetical protein
MKKERTTSRAGKEAQSRAEHLRQSKGISPPKRIEGKPSGTTMARRDEKKD